MEAKPSAECAKGGAGAYTDALQRDPQEPGGLAGLGRGVISASAFRTSYVPLSSQADFIQGLKVHLPPRLTLSPKPYLVLKFPVDGGKSSRYKSVTKRSPPLMCSAVEAPL